MKILQALTNMARLAAAHIYHLRQARKRARSLRQLEKLDQAALNDLGLSRCALVSLSHGDEAGLCAAY